MAISLTPGCTSNVTQYNALLIGLQIARELGLKKLQAYIDSELIVYQIRGEYEVQHENLIPYYQVVIQIAEKFELFYIGHIPHRQNASTDALASLAVSLAPSAGATEKVLVFFRDLYCPKPTLQQTVDRDINLPSIESHETSASTGLETGDRLSLTMSSTTSALTIPRKQSQSDGKLCAFIMTKKCGSYNV